VSLCELIVLSSLPLYYDILVRGETTPNMLLSLLFCKGLLYEIMGLELYIYNALSKLSTCYGSADGFRGLWNLGEATGAFLFSL